MSSKTSETSKRYVLEHWCDKVMKGINRAAGHGACSYCVRIGTDTGNGEHELCAARDHMFQVNAIGRFDALLERFMERCSLGWTRKSWTWWVSVTSAVRHGGTSVVWSDMTVHDTHTKSDVCDTVLIKFRICFTSALMPHSVDDSRKRYEKCMLRVMKLFFTEHFVVWVVVCFQLIAAGLWGARSLSRGARHDKVQWTRHQETARLCTHKVTSRSREERRPRRRRNTSACASRRWIARSIMSQHQQSRWNKHCIVCNKNLWRRKHALKSKSIVHLSSAASFPADAQSTNFGHSAEELHSYTKFRQCGPRSKVEFSSYNHFTREVCAPWTSSWLRAKGTLLHGCEHKKPKHVLDDEIKLTSLEAKRGCRSPRWQDQRSQRSMMLRFQCYPNKIFFSRSRRQMWW